MRILFIVRPDSVHSARWINQITELGWDIHVFPTHHVAWHSAFRNVTTYQVMPDVTVNLDQSVKRRMLWPFQRGWYWAQSLPERFLPQHYMDRAIWLARLIHWLKPDLIHSLESQAAGYLTMRATKHYKGNLPLWAVSCWGNDLYLFGSLATHESKIREMVNHCDYFWCESRRDIELARAYGYRGPSMPVVPMAGGFRVDELQRYRAPGPTSSRKLILLKGYQHWAGRALCGLRAIELCAELIKSKGMRVVMYLVNPDVAIAAEKLTSRTGLQIEVPDNLVHETMLTLHGQARVSIGLSISDGVPQSAIEAMVMGSMPIQSDTGCLNEYVRDGESALFVPPEDPQAIANALTKALTDDNLVDRAASINLEIALREFDYSIIQPTVIAAYNWLSKQHGQGSSLRTR